MESRQQEVRRLLALSVEEVAAAAGNTLVITENLESLYSYLAEFMVREFAAAQDTAKAFIMPVGPVEPYRRMAELINSRSIPLKNVWFFFMDEYCNDDDTLIDFNHPLSFRGKIDGLFFDHIRPELKMNPRQIIFPTPENLPELPKWIAELGGIEVCYGGIGIHGHVAFNEPMPGVADTNPRLLDINDFTRTIDSARGGSGGNLVNFPRRAITLGMKQCLEARKMLLMTRNEIPGLNWCNTVARIAALGQTGDDYPVTHIRRHPAATVVTDRASITAPRWNI